MIQVSVQVERLLSRFRLDSLISAANNRFAHLAFSVRKLAFNIAPPTTLSSLPRLKDKSEQVQQDLCGEDACTV